MEHILGEGQGGPNGKQLAILFLPPVVSWVVNRYHGQDMWAVDQMLASKTLLLRC